MVQGWGWGCPEGSVEREESRKEDVMGILAQEFLGKKSPKKKSGAQSGKGFKSAENIKDSGSSSNDDVKGENKSGSGSGSGSGKSE